MAIEHGPAELAHLGPIVEGALGAEDGTEQEERIAEAAYDEYDAWVEERCE